MRGNPGSYYGAAFIKGARLKSVKPSKIIQEANFADKDINVAAESISGRSKEFNDQH